MQFGPTEDDHSAITCMHVIEGAPVLIAGRFSDGRFDLLCGAETHADEDLRIVHTSHLIEFDKTLLEIIPSLPPANSTARDTISDPWDEFEVDDNYVEEDEQAEPLSS